MKSKPVNPSQKICGELEDAFVKSGGLWNQRLASDVPRKWKMFGDLMLIRQGSCFTLEEWSQLGFPKIWQSVASALNVSRIAIYGGVKSDEFRSPKVTLVWPVVSSDQSEEWWVTKRENGIVYSFDVTRSMFSVGNFSEKARLADLVNREPVVPDGETAVDMFTGIGYFSLSLLVKCQSNRIKTLHCCEWNPAAVKALRRNLKENNVNDPARCIIHEGDCRQVAPVAVCQRVFLGLIPSSELAWPAASKALSPLTGGIVHVHSLVDVSYDGAVKAEVNQCATKFARLLAVSHPATKWAVWCSFVSNVKFYGPQLRHIVVDLNCFPMK